MTADDLPVVTNRDVLDDAMWFDVRPERRFRARPRDHGGNWLVLKRGNVFLRTLTRQAVATPQDSDAELGPLWFATAFPEQLAEHAGRQERKAGVRR